MSEAAVAGGSAGARALGDLRVVEVGSGVAAPFCSRLFADFGAEVIKIEPSGGDPSRGWPSGGADGALFAFLNTGKRSVVIDLRDESNHASLDGLLATADILIENLEPYEREHWGLQADDLLARHPQLIVVSLTPFGLTGEWADRPGGDLEAAAFSSLAFGLGEPEKAPLRLPYDQSEYQVALHGAVAALCALRAREQGGTGGQSLDVATAQVMGYCTGGMYLVTAKAGVEWGRRGRLLRGVYPTGFFECADGYICIASQSPKQWEKFISIMDEPEWAQAPEARNAMMLGAVDPSPVDPHFRDWIKGFTRRELTELAMEKDITLGQVNTVDELLAEPHFEDRGLWFEVEASGDKVKMPRPGYLLSRTPAALGPRAPELGEGNDEFLGDISHAAARRESTGSARGKAGDEPLAGIRVVEFGWNWAGPMAGQLLADMGAEVIRVETEKRQDVMRLLPYMSHFFCNANRSKRSISVNLGAEDGPELVRRLVSHSDVVMDNFAAGVMARNGLAYDDLVTVKEDIICVSMSMAGQHGPLSQMRGFASIATGFAGLERMVGYDGEDPIGLMAFGLGDTNLAIQGALGVLAALHHRDSTGEGQFVDVSQIESSIGTLAEPIIDFQLTGEIAGPQGNRHSAHYPHDIYRCDGDDRWLALSVHTSGEWQSLCGVLGRANWGSDESLKSAEGRRALACEIDQMIAAWVGERERDEAIRELVAAGVRCAPVLTRPERDSHPHFAERELVIEHVTEGFDNARIYSTPWIFSATPARMTKPAPLLGEDNNYVFGEVMGMSSEEIAGLAELGAIS